MSFGLKIIETPQVRSIRQVCKAAESRSGILAVGAPVGSGKSTSAEVVCSEQSWPVHPGRVLANAGRYERVNLTSALEIFRAVALFSTPVTFQESYWLKSKFREVEERREREIKESFCSNRMNNVPYEHLLVDRGQLVSWLKEFAAEKKGGQLDEIRALLEVGLIPEAIPRHVIYLRAKILTTPGVILADLCREVCGVRPWAMADRLHMVHDALKRLKILLLCDEADRLSVLSLEFFRELNDICHVPIVLLGTRALLDRLRYNVALRPLGTRVNFTVELGPPTLKDIQEGLPDLPRGIVMRAWARSGGNLRLLSFILAEMGRAAEGPKRRRPSRELVDAIADRLPLSQAASVLDPEETASVGAENKAPAISAAAAQGVGRRRVGTAR